MQILGVMEEFNDIIEKNKNLPPNEQIEFDVEKLGKGIEFYGYDKDEKLDLSQAITKTSFIFDGVDDYIVFPYEDDVVFDNGFTLEFYGKILGPRE